MAPITYLEVRGQFLGVRAPLTLCDCYRILGSTFICWAILPAHTDIFKIVGRERADEATGLTWNEFLRISNTFPEGQNTCILEAGQTAPGRNKPGHWATKFPWPLRQPRRQKIARLCSLWMSGPTSAQRTAAAQHWWDQHQISGWREDKGSTGSWLRWSSRYCQPNWDQPSPARQF